jgi:hypothetical protein
VTVELTIKGDIEVLRLQPDDLIVVSLDYSITPERAQFLAAELEKRFPKNNVLIVADGAKLSVQRDEVAS